MLGCLIKVFVVGLDVDVALPEVEEQSLEVELAQNQVYSVLLVGEKILVRFDQILHLAFHLLVEFPLLLDVFEQPLDLKPLTLGFEEPEF